jgi:outer membrane protein
LKHYIRLAFVLMIPALFAAQAHAELKLGYVDAVRLLEDAPQAQEATRRLQSEFASREQEISRAQDEIKRIEDGLNRDGAVLSESERRNRSADVLSRKRELRRMQEEFREDLNIRRNEALGGLQDQIKESIQEVGKADGYDLIFFEGIAYANAAMDMTNKVLAGLTKRYQSTGTGSAGTKR